MTRTPIRYRNLTPEQKKIICNGCGGKGSIIPVPNFCFGASCDHHDFNYWLGCQPEQRKKADKQFLTEMLKDAKRVKPPRAMAFICNAFKIHTKYYESWAYTFYAAVRLRGGKYFNYAPMQRTLEDLNRVQKTLREIASKSKRMVHGSF